MGAADSLDAAKAAFRAASVVSAIGRGFWSEPYSGLMLAARITLPHFSVSSAISFPKSPGEPERTVIPRSANRALTTGLARPALIAWLSLLMTSAGVFPGAPTP